MNPEIVFDQTVGFETRLKRVFRYQYENVRPYRVFCEELGVNPESLKGGNLPPLLPVEAFRDAVICTETPNESTLRFKSSGTSGMKRSTHFVPDSELYKRSIFEGMRQFYPLDEFVTLTYTPGYNENPDSSLIWMLKQIIEHDVTGLSRFLELNEPVSPLALDAIKASGKRILLFGAAFGLIDLAERFPFTLPEGTLIMETGGMKTHRREISREELHTSLAQAFGLDESKVHSEYGMTELLSQAYSDGSGWFRPPHWMRVSVQNPHNPLEEASQGDEGLIGIIDLANVHSCSFILTGDKGIMKPGGLFRVLGRYVPENLRGCNFLIDQD